MEHRDARRERADEGFTVGGAGGAAAGSHPKPPPPQLRTDRRPAHRLAALLVLSLATVLLALFSAPSPARAQDGGTPPALAVSASPSATTVPVGEAVTLSAEITGAPAGSPSYVWRMSFGGDYWLTLSTTATASYLTSGVETVSFQVTVSYGSGESATSDAVSVSFVAPTSNTPDPPTAKSQTPPTPPAAPSGLAATPGNGRVSLSWSDPSDSTISGYQVRRSADGGTSWSPDWTDIAGSGATTTSHTVSGLTNATAYRFELRAVAGSVNGASASASAMPAGPLVQNLNKYAVGIGGGTNTVSSDAAQAFTTGSNAGGYRLTYVILGFVLDAGAAESTGYTVKLCDDSGGAPGSACDTLSAPAALAGGGNLFTASGAGIDLSPDTTYWIVFDSVSGGTGTVELRRTADDGEDAASAAGWTIADDGQSRGRAATGAWSSGGNPHKVGVFGYARTAPAAPANLQVTTAAGYLGAVLDWDDVDGADDYLVRWRPAGPDQVLNEGLRPTSSNTAITVEEDGDYVVRVQACRGSTCGAAVAERFTVAPLPPGPPANFVLAAATDGFEVTASWDASEEATSYTLTWQSLEGTGLTGGSREVTGTSTTVEVAGSGDWQFSLQACNDGGCGATLIETVDVANVTAAQGQSNEEQNLVSNLISGTDGVSTNGDFAQVFTTGSSSGGYTVKRVTLEFKVTGAVDTYTVSLWSTTASGALGTKLVDFTNPATTTNGFNNFTLATAQNLEPDTSYAIVFDRTGSSSTFGSIATSWDGEQSDNHTGAPGWSIANGSTFRTHSSTGAWTAHTEAMRILVAGAARAPTTAPATFVSNLNNASNAAHDDPVKLTLFDQAQAFTTGGDTAGYVLTELKINMKAVGTAANKPTYTLQVCSTDGSGHPTSTCHGELQGPSSLATGVGANTFTPKSGGIVLNHNTTYAVVWDTTNGGTGYSIDNSSSTNEHAGAVLGWSIANVALKRTQTTGTTWDSTQIDTLLIALTGRLKFATAAELLSAEIDGSTLILGYARGLNTAAPVPGRFGRTVGSTAGNATAASVDGRLLKLTVPAVSSGDTVTFFYTVPTTGNKLKDIDGNEIARVSHEAVTNLTGVTPSLSSAVIDGDTLVLTFDREVAAGVISATSLGIRVDGGGSQAATAVDISGKQATLTVPAVTAGQSVKTRYTKTLTTSQFRLKDLFGNEFPSFTNQDVTNRTGSTPAAPTGLTAKPGDAQVVLSWTDPADPFISKYQIRQSTDGGSSWSPDWTDISGSGATTTTHTVTSLTNGTNYTFELRAVNAHGNGASASVTAAPPRTLVQNLGQTAKGATNIRSNDAAQAFTTGTHTNGYRLSRVTIEMRVNAGALAPSNYSLSIQGDSAGEPDGTAIGDLLEPAALNDGNNTIEAAGAGIDLSANTTYWLVFDTISTEGGSGVVMRKTELTAEDTGGLTGWSIADTHRSRSSGTTTWGAAASDPHKIGLFGSAKTAAAGRKLVGNIVASASFDDGVNRDVQTQFTTGTQSANLTHAEITVSTLGTPPTTYALELWSTGSGAAKLATFTPPAALAAGLNTFTLTTPESLTASTTYALVWDQGEAAGTFFLGRSGNHNEDSDGLTGWSITNGASRRAHDSTAAFGTPSGGASRIALYGRETAAVAAPTGLRATPGDAQVVLNWTDPSNTAITKYQVRQSTDGGSTWSAWTDIASSGAATTTHTVSGLTNATTYTFGLRAVAGTLNGPSSASVRATPAAQLVKNLNATTTGTTPTSVVTDDTAQAFTTGSNELGYTVSYLHLGMGVGTGATVPSDYSVKICNNDASDPAKHVPGTTCTDLLEPAALASGANTFTASGAGIVLSASTKYWVVFDTESGDGSGTVEVRRAFVTAEDTGAAAGWGIGDDGASRLRAGTTWATGNKPQKIGIYGYARTGPAAPAGLSAQAGNGQVTLSWTNPNNAEISGYQYRQSTDGGTNWSAWTDIPGSGASTTSYTVGSLSNGQAYTFQVRAVADQGATPGSASTSVTATPTGPPAAPTGFRATPGDGQIKLTWTDPSNAQITQYQIRSHISGGPWGPWSIVGGSGATTTSDTLSSLTNGKTYSVQIRAVAGSVNGASSAIVRATPAGQLVKNLNKNIGGAAGTNIVANDAAQAFTTGSNGPGYTLSYVVLGAGGSGTPPPSSGYSVKVCNDSSGAPGTTCTELGEPAALAGGGADVFTASVEGIVLSASTKYWIVFDSDSGGSGTWELRRTTDDGEDSGATAGFSIADDGVTRARATSTSWGNTDANPLKLGIYGSTRTGPSALSNLAAVISRGQAALSWTASTFTGVDKYQYRVSDDGGTSWDPNWSDIPGGANATSYTVRNLTNGAEYTIQVRAVAGTLTGASTPVTAALPYLPAPAPTGLKAAPGDAQLALSWTDPSDSGIEKYEFRQRPAGGDWTDWADVPSSDATTTTHTATGLTNWTRYTVELRAVRGTGALTATGRSASVSGTPNGPLVSTIGRTDSGNSTDLSVWDVAQAFSTGSHPHGYTLTDVTISLWVLAGKTPSLVGLIAMICPEASADGPPDYTDSETHNCLTPALTVPDVTEGTNNLSAGAGGIRLSANTRYFLVLDGNAAVSSTTNLDVTAASGADAGAAAGWSIGKYSRRDNSNNTWAEITAVRTRMAVVGKPRSPAPVFGGGGGGGGAPARRTAEPSEEDFAWNVTRDIEALDGENDQPTGIWSDGETLWVVENAPSGEDRLFAYDLATGERLPEQDLALFNRNRSSNGIWSDGKVVWVADAGQDDTLFAYDLATKERLPEQDIELAEGNRQPSGIWGQDGLLLVLNRNPSLFLYDQVTGELVAELPLDRILNRSPRGIWSDGVTIWVSDDRSDRILAYRLVEHEVEVEIEPADGAEPDPADPQAEGQDEPAAAPETKIVIRHELVRHEAEDFGFRTLIAAGNSHPRGIWSDGEVMFVADAQDNRVYSYNLPDAIDAHLSALTLSGIELGEFSFGALSYAAEVAHDVERTTVEATPAHDGATVVIAPADLDDDPENGHQVAVEDGVQIEVTVLSEDESRTRVYTITLERANRAPVASEPPVVELTAGDEPAVLNLDDYFSDPDGDGLSYTVGASSDDEVATVEAAGPMLRITPVGAGIVSFAVSASDGELESEPRLIVVTVDPAAPVAPPIEVRLAARRVEAGWVEFGLQERADDGGWEERLLPRFRFLAPDSPVDRWRVSSAIEVGEGEAARTLRIVARPITNGRVEFVLVIRQDDGRWSAHLLPNGRILPADSVVGRWRYTRTLDVGSP